MGDGGGGGGEGGGVGLCIWKMGGLENRGLEGVPKAGKERAVDGSSKRVEIKVGKMEENYKTMPNILQQKKARLRGGSPEERVRSWKCKV